MFHFIVLLIILIQLYLTRKDKISSMIFFVVTLMLIPNVVKYQLGGMGIVYSYFTGICVLPLLLKKKILFFDIYVFPLYCLLLYQLLHIFITEVPVVLQIKNLVLLFFTCYILYILPIVCINTRTALFRVNKALYIAALIVSIYGLITFVLGINPYFQYLIRNYPQGLDASSFMEDSRGVISSRVFSTMGHPLGMGQILTLFFFYLRNTPSSIKNERIYEFSLYIILLTALLSGSRAVFFSIIVFFVLEILWKGNIKAKIRSLIPILVFIFAIIIIVGEASLSDLIYSYFGSLSFDVESEGMGGSSGSLRLFQLLHSLEIIRNDLLWGMGIGFIHEYGDNYPEMLGYESIIFQKLIDEGVIGLFLYFLFYVFLLKLSRKTVRRKEFSAWSTCFMFSYIISIVLTGDQQSSGYFFFLYLLMIKQYKFKKYGCLCDNSKL